MAGIRFGDFDHRQGMRQRIHSGATIFLRHFNAHQTHFAHLAHRFQWKLARFVEFGGDRCDLALGKVSHRRKQHLVFFAHRQAQRTRLFG